MSERPDDGIDTGEPIAELKLLAEPTASGLYDRVRTRINRRMLGAEFVRYSWFVPILVAFEYIKVLFEMLAPDTKGEERKP